MSKWLEIIWFLIRPIPPAPREPEYGRRFFPSNVESPDQDE